MDGDGGKGRLQVADDRYKREDIFPENTEKIQASLSAAVQGGKAGGFQPVPHPAESCLTHNAYEELSGISCPVLILGGGDDKIVGTDAAPEMAEKIKQCKMIIYEGLGHGAYDETEDFNRQVMDFLNETALEENV